MSLRRVGLFIFFGALLELGVGLAPGCGGQLHRELGAGAAPTDLAVHGYCPDAPPPTSTCPDAVACFTRCPRLPDGGVGHGECQALCESGLAPDDLVFARTVLTCAEAACVVELPTWKQLFEPASSCWRDAVMAPDGPSLGAGACRAAWLACSPPGVS